MTTNSVTPFPAITDKRIAFLIRGNQGHMPGMWLGILITISVLLFPLTRLFCKLHTPALQRAKYMRTTHAL